MYRKPTTRDVKQHEWHLGSSLWMTEPRQVFFWLSCNPCYGYEIVVKPSNQISIFEKLFTDCHLSVAAPCTSTPFPLLLYIRGLHNPYGVSLSYFLAQTSPAGLVAAENGSLKQKLPFQNYRIPSIARRACFLDGFMVFHQHFKLHLLPLRTLIPLWSKFYSVLASQKYHCD